MTHFIQLKNLKFKIYWFYNLHMKNILVCHKMKEANYYEIFIQHPFIDISMVCYANKKQIV